MYFYKVETELLNYNEDMTKRDFARNMQLEQFDFLNESKGFVYIFVSKIKTDSLTLGVIIRDNSNIEAYINTFFGETGFECNLRAIEEITIDTIKGLMTYAERAGFIRDCDELYSVFEIERVFARCHSIINYSEGIIQGDEDITDKLDVYGHLARDIVREELERINTKPATERCVGHPVHYIVGTDTSFVSKAVDRMLVAALYDNERILSKRYMTIDMEAQRRSYDEYEELYKISRGGAVIVDFTNEFNNEGIYASGSTAKLEKICHVAEYYKSRVLTIFNVPKRCNKLKNKLYELISGMSFVELNEHTLSGVSARNYFEILAEESCAKADDKLMKSITDDDRAYRAVELDLLFDKWLSNKLKKEVYPQYSHIAAVDVVNAEKKPSGSAYDELMEMIGLEGVKSVVNQAVKFYKAQKLLEKRGVKRCNTAMHMVFTGNPGTAKTSVARLFARIMKDNGILSVGDLYELGRADLVGKYVGWTAQIVKNRFRDAKGSVLFIDEAYSLADASNSFGDEAINTIVQEMENNREDMIVIFAGYPQEMENFLRKNPGLRSRIAYHIGFDDYTADELYAITELMASRNDMSMDSTVKERLLPVFEAARKNSDFGNGRFARNLFEKAKMNQVSRLMDIGLENIADDSIFTLTAEDFDISEAENKDKRKVIGFV